MLVLIFWVLVLIGPIAIIINPGEKDLVLWILIWFGCWLPFGVMLFGLHYVIRGEQLFIKIGRLVVRRIPISSIRTIHAKFSLWAAPAASLQRLHIHYGKYDEVRISPRDQENFLCELRRINPEIEYKPKS